MDVVRLGSRGPSRTGVAIFSIGALSIAIATARLTAQSPAPPRPLPQARTAPQPVDNSRTGTSRTAPNNRAAPQTQSKAPAQSSNKAPTPRTAALPQKPGSNPSPQTAPTPKVPAVPQPPAEANPGIVADTGEAEWIWTSALNTDGSAPGTVYFRKAFTMQAIDTARIQIACDDRYELYVNGRKIGTGDDWHVMSSFDVAKYLLNGRNVVAIKALNTSGATAGLVARVTVRARGATEVSYSTDTSWRTSATAAAGWERVNFNDTAWVAARSFGELGAKPWGDDVRTADGSPVKRFAATDDFRVERVLPPQMTGSAIAMAFNEWGELLVAREGAGLLLVIDKNKDGIPDTPVKFCDEVKSIQGILPLNGEVFVVGDGPQGAALYRLIDDNGDGRADQVRALVAFERGMAEHGPHGLALGPDGMIYLMIGNHSAVKPVGAEDRPANQPDDGSHYSASSPYLNWYEGDLLTPKYEDANGHAVGIKAPCGTIVRTDIEGNSLQLYAGGLRNAYDLAFNNQGELFTHDSDMEWDAGLPWYRPTRVYHVLAGAEFGSRSGWSPWPSYWLDGVPPIAETDRGSPTGVEVYNHTAYPAQYQNAIFVGDWSHGRILAVRPKLRGASYTTEVDVFLEGRPLNVTDLAVGPDGWLYFCTGGRGTEGGVYRVVYTGTPPAQPKLSTLQQALRQPQSQSAFGRQKIAVVQEKMGSEWERQLLALVGDPDQRADDRARALGLMQLYGPPPSADLLKRLARDTQPLVRARVAFLMGTQPSKDLLKPLMSLMSDRDALVRRQACEALARGRYDCDPAMVVKALADKDRGVSFAASKLLQRLPSETWQALVIEDENVRSFLVGSSALLGTAVERDVCLKVLARCQTTLGSFLSDDDFLDLTRVIELALKHGKITGDEVPELRNALAEEYPAGEARMNRELVRINCYLQAGAIIPRLLDELHGTAPDVEKIHAAMCARFLTSGWTSATKLELLAYFEEAREVPGGHSYKGYVENVARDFAAQLNGAERQAVLKEAERWPSAALAVLATLESVPPPLVERLMELDKNLDGQTSEASLRLRTGVVALLASSNSAEAMAYLREEFETQPDRRADLAMGLAQQPNGPNWPLLVRSLAVVDGGAAQEVLTQLLASKERSDDPQLLRQVIIAGLRLKDEGGAQAAQLLNQWVGQNVSQPDEPWDKALARWQTWYSEQFPDELAAELPVEPEGSRWTMQELLNHLETDEARSADPVRGKIVFEKAQCIRCHRYAGRGESIGPDLSTVSQRFQRKEILESMIFPSLVISDQYAAKTVTTTAGKAYTGIVGAAGADAIVVLQANGQKVTVRRSDIDETVPSRKSAMPEGLLDKLSLDEIAELFAYLTKPQETLARQPKAAR